MMASEQLRRWLDETEDNESVLGVDDEIEFEEDNWEYHLRSENDENGMDDELDDVPDILKEEEEEPAPTNERPCFIC